MHTRTNCLAIQGAAALLLFSSARVGHTAPPPPPDEATLAQDRGDAAADAGHLNEALESWHESWSLRPNNRQVGCNIARAEVRRNDYRAAATWLNRCINLLGKATKPSELERQKELVLEYVTPGTAGLTARYVW